MLWNNSYNPLDLVDPPLVNDENTPTNEINNNNVSDNFLSVANSTNDNLISNNVLNMQNNLNAILDIDLNSVVLPSTTNTTNTTNTPVSSISSAPTTSSATDSFIQARVDAVHTLDDELLNFDDFSKYYSTSNNYNTIDTSALTNVLNSDLNLSINMNFNPISNSNLLSTTPFQQSPILKSQKPLNSQNHHHYQPPPQQQSQQLTSTLSNPSLHFIEQSDIQNIDYNYNNYNYNYNYNSSMTPPTSRESLTHSEGDENENYGIGEETYDEDEERGRSHDGENEKSVGKSTKSKKISDSRLSLAQLSIVLNLEGKDDETARREKNILKILKTDLNFPIGEKTWIRDTPVEERERLLDSLTSKVEEIYHYGYSKKTLSIIVRRASYYMMQGRLRRERRLQRRKKSQANKLLNNKMIQT